MFLKPWTLKLLAADSSVFSKDIVRNRDGAGEAHMGCGRCVIAFRYVSDHRRHQRIAQSFRNPLRQDLSRGMLLAQRDIGAALFGGADGNEDGGLAGRDLGAQFGPGQLFKDDVFGVCAKRVICVAVRNKAATKVRRSDKA